MLVNPVRVFIVDDSPQITEMLRELLSDPGHVEIVGFADAAPNAIEQIQLSNPDVVVVDLQLKDGNGFDVIKAVRLLPQAQNMLIILFTNHASRELQKHGTDLGADFFLDKSTDHAKILEILQNAVRASQLDVR